MSDSFSVAHHLLQPTVVRLEIGLEQTNAANSNTSSICSHDSESQSATIGGKSISSRGEGWSRKMLPTSPPGAFPLSTCADYINSLSHSHMETACKDYLVLWLRTLPTMLKEEEFVSRVVLEMQDLLSVIPKICERPKRQLSVHNMSKPAVWERAALGQERRGQDYPTVNRGNTQFNIAIAFWDIRFI
ncbi:hypothetical protein CPB84DRAFT_1748724 [Gymnopilus junonius]|uniref:Uncharacterized protein n=1 Tax=Gymnopilus junonius TaxID=109634 RepID=A0A9P5TKK6_GYMJU|nr:hypothetical protein CPB84DRAFT_1748724 [Gymnopilus junonius]